MILVSQFKLGASPVSVFNVPSNWPAAGFGPMVRVQGNEVAFTRTSSTQITLRSPAPAGSLVDLFNVIPPTAAGLAWVGSLDFPSIAPQASTDLTASIQGAEVGDLVTCGHPAAIPSGVIITYFVSAANVVTIRASNITIAAIDPVSLSFRIRVAKA